MQAKLCHFILAAVALSMIATNSYAQSVFGNPPANPRPPTTQKGAASKPLTPEEFKSMVSTQAQQNEQANAEKLKAKLPPPSKQGQAPATAATMQQSTPAPAAAPESTSQYSIGSTPPAPQAPFQQQAPQQATTQPAAPTYAPPNTAAPAQPAQSGVYTGFQGDPNKSNNTKSNKSSTGWNVQY